MNIKRISDIAQSEQTEDLKLELYKLVQQFVYKYQKHYHPHFKGEIDDLISDFYADFLTPKSRVKGKEESLLDKFNPEITTLPYLVKTAVIRKLIDRERTDKREINYAEKYSEKTGELTVDYLVNKVANEDTPIEKIEFTEDEIAELRDRYDDMDESAKEAFLEYYNKVKEKLTPNFKDLFEDLTGAKEERRTSVSTVIKKEFPELKSVQIEEHKVKSGKALKFTFDDESTWSDESLLNEVEEWMMTKGYDFYTKRKNIWYFIKK